MSTIPDKIPLLISGPYPNFYKTKSIKLKNRKGPLMIQGNQGQNYYTDNSIYTEPPLKNSYLKESELIYDGKDNDYVYYHIRENTGNDNFLFIIQA